MAMNVVEGFTVCRVYCCWCCCGSGINLLEIKIHAGRRRGQVFRWSKSILRPEGALSLNFCCLLWIFNHREEAGNNTRRRRRRWKPLAWAKGFSTWEIYQFSQCAERELGESESKRLKINTNQCFIQKQKCLFFAEETFAIGLERVARSFEALFPKNSHHRLPL